MRVRLTKQHNLPPSGEAVVDPAHGERVPRCRVCGVPETKGNKLIPGMWGYLRFNMPLDLCERCVLYIAPIDRMEADPMQLHDAA